MALYLPDVNVLIHCLHAASPHHAACKKWLDKSALNGDELGLAELVEVALLRITTLPKLQLIPVHDVLGFWREDLGGYPGIRYLAAGSGHREVFNSYINDLALFGNDINDAWLAALAVEHEAILVTMDEGFRRFPGLKKLNPLDVM